MLIEYAGKIVNGKPEFLEKVVLPEGLEIIIMPKRKTDEEKLNEKQKEVLKKVMENVRDLRKELTQEDLEHFAALERGDYKLRFEERL